MNKTGHSPWAPPLACVFMCVMCVCVRAYIRGLNNLRQSINTHDAAGEAGRRVRVSQHTHITPPLSLSPFYQSILSSSSLFSSSSSTSIIFHAVAGCLFHGKNTEDFTWQANFDLQLVLIVRGNNQCKQNKTINYIFTRGAF